MSLSTPDFLVNVPALNPRTNPGTPAPVRFLNPGVTVDGDEARMFRPEGLPMAEPVVKAMMAQFAALARESKSAADLAPFAPGIREDFHAGTSFAIKDELAAASAGRDKEIEAGKLRSKAQTELCLAWVLEEYALELAGLQDAFGEQWSTFERDLGLADEEDLEAEGDALAGAMPDFVPSPQRVKAQVLVDAVLTFLPEGCGLYCSDEALLADWEEYGVRFSPASEQTLDRFGLAGSFRQASAPGHLLCLSKRPDPARPWQAGERLVVAPGGE